MKNKNTESHAYTYEGKGINFAAAEAYKLLRTNLMFSLAGKDHCPIIGVTSSIRGEGKSTTSAHLSYSFAESNNRVLLLELDLRLPTVARRFSIRKSPGFSNLIIGNASVEEAIVPSGLHDNFHVITAGDIPPNPSELLSLEGIETIFNKLKEDYDYIVVDLPPVNAVSDALNISRLVDGLVLVVRENYSRKREVDEALRRLKMVNAPVLGFAVNDDSKEDKESGYRYKYRYGYGYSYKHSAKG